MTILEDIITEARAYALAGRPFLAVFDLDSTLFDLTPRVLEICGDFARDPEKQKLYKAECETLRQLQIHNTDWGISEGLTRLGLSASAHAGFWGAIHKYWENGFFANDYLHHDVALPGAVEFVLALRHEGADIMYLTGRDVPRMYDGTARSLTETGFPLDAKEARLVLKPDQSMDDAAFKVDIIKDALKNYDRIWLFENEPVNTNLVARECPEVGIVFIETTHSGKEEVAAELTKIPDFRRQRPGK